MIEFLLWLSIFSVGSTVAAVYKHHEAWRLMAIELDLHYSKTFPMSGRMQGERQGFDVAIYKQRVANQAAVAIEVGPVDPGFTLRPEGAVARLIHSDVEVGEPEFDERVLVEGDSAVALAMLPAETRRTVEIVVVHGNGTVANGMVRSTVRYLGQAPSTLDSMLELAREFRQPDPEKVPALLAQRALQDASSKIRLRAFQELASSFEGSETLLATARKLRESSELPLRLEALRALLNEPAPEGTDAGEELARLVQRGNLDASQSREALVSLARGLARRGDPASQPRLLKLLEDPDVSVRKAAAEALGQVGDVSAVAPLRRLADSGQLFRSGPARAAELAIEEIKGRAGGSQAGEVSLAAVEPLQGAVSPSEESEAVEGGEVSLTS